jgi:UDP-glucose 4,6-dehydratase
MKQIFITGGAGFIGSHLCEKIFNNYKNTKIVILDKLSYSGNLFFLTNIIKSKRVKFIKGNILDYKKYNNFLKNSDIAINVAAESHVDRSFANSLLFTETNTLGAHVFFQECLEKKIKKIIHVSTDEVYGEIIKGSANELSILNPTNPYSASKAAAEVILNSYKNFYSNKIITIRANNIYGIRQYPEKIIPSFIFNLLTNKKILIHGNGFNIRCYLSVSDFTDAVLLLMKKNVNGIYNIGNTKYYKNLDIAKIICKFLDKDYKKNVKFVKDRPFNDRRYSIVINKIRKLGWRPKKELINDLPEIIEWYKKNLKIFEKKN